MSTVFPGFQDIYKQAGVLDSYGGIVARSGATFAETLELALSTGASLTQIATWKDYGEGTVIEPTRNHGYRYLEMLQKQRRAKQAFSSADLRSPVMLYQLRQRSLKDVELERVLGHTAELLFASRCLEAEAPAAFCATTSDTVRLEDPPPHRYYHRGGPHPLRGR